MPSPGWKAWIAAASLGCSGSVASDPSDAGAEVEECDLSRYSLDEDGDGYRAPVREDYPGATLLCLTEPVPVFDPDCDDQDPDVYRILYRDADGDRSVVPSETICGGASTPGYWRSSERRLEEYTDCNDADPMQGPFADEFEGDGFDADCDGVDGSAACGLRWPLMIHVLPSCPTAELFAVARECDCGRSVTFAIGNRGTAATQGPLSVDGKHFAIELAPLEYSGAFTVHDRLEPIPFGLPSGSECNIEDNTVVITPRNCD